MTRDDYHRRRLNGVVDVHEAPAKPRRRAPLPAGLQAVIIVEVAIILLLGGVLLGFGLALW
jgi:hypothetical protein